jgi:ABC-2 type transport system ATP-binding protein
MVAAISISGLVKTFGATRALDGLDLVVESGDVQGRGAPIARVLPQWVK